MGLVASGPPNAIDPIGAMTAKGTIRTSHWAEHFTTATTSNGNPDESDQIQSANVKIALKHPI